MVNEIVKGISLKLNTVFGDGYEIYQNDIEQGLTEPCFFISLLKPELSPLIGQRAMKSNPFVIQYFPTEPGNNEEMFDVAEKLLENLKFIALNNGDMLHGTAMSYEVVDGVLHFFVSFNLPVISLTNETYMGDMAMETGVKALY